MIASRFLLWVLFFCSNALIVLVSAEEGNNETTQPLDPNELDSLTDEELEQICVERGFELIQDLDDGPLTHADFVDAAQRCLAIEQDMNEILEQNPELADELVAEIDRMKEEKERLEQEQEQMLAEKQRLEAELASSERGDRMWGTATGKQSTASSSSSAFVSSQPGESTADTETDETKTTSSPTETTTAQNATASEDQTEDPCSPNAAATKEENDQSKTTDFSLKGLLQEVLEEFEKDVHRVTTLLLPVIKPLYNTGNKAWNYVKVLFRSARQHYKKYHQQQREEGQQQRQKEDDILKASQLANELNAT